MSHRQVLDADRARACSSPPATPTTSSSARRTPRARSSTSCSACFDVAVKAGATTINVPDTVGYATPAEFGELVRIVRERTPDDVVISTHCHNDLGLAVANSLAGIEHGARQVEVAVNGIGERAGNCSLEEIAMVLRTRARVARRAARPPPEGDRADVAARLLAHRLLGAAEQGGRGGERVRARERHPPARRAREPRHLRDHGPGRDRARGQPDRPRQALGAARVRRRAREGGHLDRPRPHAAGRSRASRSSPTGRSRSRTRTSRRSSPRRSAAGRRIFSSSSPSPRAAAPTSRRRRPSGSAAGTRSSRSRRWATG